MGRPKGSKNINPPKPRGYKVKGSGRKKGSKNTTTILAHAIKLTPEKCHELMNHLHDLALGVRTQGAVQAARIWLDEYNAQLKQEKEKEDACLGVLLDKDTNTLEDIKNIGSTVTKKMLLNELSLEKCVKAHDALTKQRGHIEAQLSPLVTQLLEDEMEKAKFKD